MTFLVLDRKWWYFPPRHPLFLYFFVIHHCKNSLSSLHIFVHHCTFCALLHVKTSPAHTFLSISLRYITLP